LQGIFSLPVLQDTKALKRQVWRVSCQNKPGAHSLTVARIPSQTTYLEQSPGCALNALILFSQKSVKKKKKIMVSKSHGYTGW